MPVVHPQVFIESAAEGLLLVLWVPASGKLPCYFPERITKPRNQYQAYIRRNTQTLKASAQETNELLKRYSWYASDCQYLQSNVTINDFGLNMQSCGEVHICHQYFNYPPGVEIKVPGKPQHLSTDLSID